jgi:hypothetical protein
MIAYCECFDPQEVSDSPGSGTMSPTGMLGSSVASNCAGEDTSLHVTDQPVQAGEQTAPVTTSERRVRFVAPNDSDVIPSPVAVDKRLVLSSRSDLLVRTVIPAFDPVTTDHPGVLFISKHARISRDHLRYIREYKLPVKWDSSVAVGRAWLSPSEAVKQKEIDKSIGIWIVRETTAARKRNCGNDQNRSLGKRQTTMQLMGRRAALRNC